MSTCTAELLLGAADMNESGILFKHRICIYEGSKMWLVFEKRPTWEEGGSLVDSWLAHPNNFVDAAMVMYAAYGVGDQQVLDILAELKEGHGDKREWKMYELSPESLERLYQTARNSLQEKVVKGRNFTRVERKKVMVCCFFESSLERHMNRFLDYDVDVELCKSFYRREYSVWNNCINERGELA